MYRGGKGKFGGGRGRSSGSGRGRPHEDNKEARGSGIHHCKNPKNNLKKMGCTAVAIKWYKLSRIEDVMIKTGHGAESRGKIGNVVTTSGKQSSRTQQSSQIKSSQVKMSSQVKSGPSKVCQGKPSQTVKSQVVVSKNYKPIQVVSTIHADLDVEPGPSHGHAKVGSGSELRFNSTDIRERERSVVSGANAEPIATPTARAGAKRSNLGGVKTAKKPREEDTSHTNESTAKKYKYAVPAGMETGGDYVGRALRRDDPSDGSIPIKSGADKNYARMIKKKATQHILVDRDEKTFDVSQIIGDSLINKKILAKVREEFARHTPNKEYIANALFRILTPVAIDDQQKTIKAYVDNSMINSRGQVNVLTNPRHLEEVMEVVRERYFSEQPLNLGILKTCIVPHAEKLFSTMNIRGDTVPSFVEESVTYAKEWGFIDYTNIGRVLGKMIVVVCDEPSKHKPYTVYLPAKKGDNNISWCTVSGKFEGDYNKGMTPYRMTDEELTATLLEAFDLAYCDQREASDIFHGSDRLCLCLDTESCTVVGKHSITVTGSNVCTVTYARPGSLYLTISRPTEEVKGQPGLIHPKHSLKPDNGIVVALRRFSRGFLLMGNDVYKDINKMWDTLNASTTSREICDITTLDTALFLEATEFIGTSQTGMGFSQLYTVGRSKVSVYSKEQILAESTYPGDVANLKKYCFKGDTTTMRQVMVGSWCYKESDVTTPFILADLLGTFKIWKDLGNVSRDIVGEVGRALLLLYQDLDTDQYRGGDFQRAGDALTLYNQKGREGVLTISSIRPGGSTSQTTRDNEKRVVRATWFGHAEVSLANTGLLEILNRWRDARNMPRFTIDANISEGIDLVDVSPAEERSRSQYLEMEVDHDHGTITVDSLTTHHPTVTLPGISLVNCPTTDDLVIIEDSSTSSATDADKTMTGTEDSGVYPSHPIHLLQPVAVEYPQTRDDQKAVEPQDEQQISTGSQEDIIILEDRGTHENEREVVELDGDQLAQDLIEAQFADLQSVVQRFPVFTPAQVTHAWTDPQEDVTKILKMNSYVKYLYSNTELRHIRAVPQFKTITPDELDELRLSLAVQAIVVTNLLKANLRSLFEFCTSHGWTFKNDMENSCDPRTLGATLNSYKESTTGRTMGKSLLLWIQSPNNGLTEDHKQKIVAFLVRSERMKLDSCLRGSGFKTLHHSFCLSETGKWFVRHHYTLTGEAHRIGWSRIDFRYLLKTGVPRTTTATCRQEDAFKGTFRNWSRSVYYLRKGLKWLLHHVPEVVSEYDIKIVNQHVWDSVVRWDETKYYSRPWDDALGADWRWFLEIMEIYGWRYNSGFGTAEGPDCDVFGLARTDFLKDLEREWGKGYVSECFILDKDRLWNTRDEE